MTHFWSTLAIVNAIWASTGTVDVWTVLQVLLTGWCLFMLIQAEKKHPAKVIK